MRKEVNLGDFIHVKIHHTDTPMCHDSYFIVVGIEDNSHNLKYTIIDILNGLSPGCEYDTLQELTTDFEKRGVEIVNCIKMSDFLSKN